MSDFAPPANAGMHGHAHAHHPALQHHFDTLEQQQHAAAFGMWVFLVTEVLFFGGLFMAYVLYRTWYPDMFVRASHELDLTLGAFNTVVLIGSSLTMALAVHAAQVGNRRAIVLFMILTMVLGAIFLGVKVIEYSQKIEHHLVPGPHFQFPEPWGAKAQLYYSLYFAMTGLHAAHMIIGMGIMTVITIMAAKGRFTPEWYTPVEITGLYWHFVDIVWIFLFPLLYLIGGAH